MTDSHKFSLYALATFIIMMSFALALDAFAYEEFTDSIEDTGGTALGQLIIQEFEVYEEDPTYLTHIDLNNDWAKVYVCKSDGIANYEVTAIEDFKVLYDCEGNNIMGQGTCYPMTDFATSTRTTMGGRCVLDFPINISVGNYYWALSAGEYALLGTSTISIGGKSVDEDPLGADKDSLLYQTNYDGNGNDRVIVSWGGWGEDSESGFQFINFYATDTINQIYPPGYETPAWRWLWDNTISIWYGNTMECELGSPCQFEYRYNEMAAEAFGYGVYISFSDEDFAERYVAFQYFDEDLGLVPDYPGQWWNTLTIPEPIGDGNIVGQYDYSVTVAMYPPDSRDFISKGALRINWLPAGTRIARGQKITEKIRPGWCDVNDTCGLTDVECGLKEAGRWLICPSASTTEMVQEATSYAASKFPLNLIFSTKEQFISLSTSTPTATASIPFLVYGKNGVHTTQYLMKSDDWGVLDEGKVWLFKIFDTLFYGMGLIGLWLIVQRLIGRIHYKENKVVK